MEEKLPFNLPDFKLDEIKNDGTDLGTFKSVKTLKDAYDSLRSCFTKNAMELAEIKKSVSNTNNFNTEVKVDNSALDKAETPTQNDVDKAKAPRVNAGDILDNADWSNKIEQFFNKNPNARDYSQDIAKALVQDKEIMNSDDPFMSAWAKIVNKKASEVRVDDDFINKNILNNPQIKDLIIKNYLNEIKTLKSAPSVIASSVGTVNQANPHTRIVDMEQAKELTKKLFK